MCHLTELVQWLYRLQVWSDQGSGSVSLLFLGLSILLGLVFVLRLASLLVAKCSSSRLHTGIPQLRGLLAPYPHHRMVLGFLLF